MNDHLLVEALRSRDSGAPAAVYEAYADRLYAYCWFQLRGRDAAQVALRDTFIVAEAHIDKLRDPDRFGPWLYAIARLECGRRMPYGGQPPDLPVASHDQEDVDQRIMAWQAVLGLAPLSREILELRVRHQLSVPDLAAVFDLPVKEAQAALDRAHAELEVALTAEILAHQGPYGCAERAQLLRERRGEMNHGLRARLLRHAEECSICGTFRPRTVSAAKVYGLLPQAEPPDALRLRVMSCFLDPELVGYRLFVATRVSEFTPGGFPVQPRRSVLPRRAGPSRGSALPWRKGARRGGSRRPGGAERKRSGRKGGGESRAAGADDARVADPTGGTGRTGGPGSRGRLRTAVVAVAGFATGVVRGSRSDGVAETGSAAATTGGAPIGRGETRDGRFGAGVRRGVAATALALIVLGAAAGLVGYLIDSGHSSGRDAAGGPAHPRVPSIPPADDAPEPVNGRGPDSVSGSPVSATFPLGAQASSAPPSATLPAPPRRDYQTAPDGHDVPPSPPGGSGLLLVSPLYLDLAGASDGTVTLQATGGSISWRATTWGPVRSSQSAGRLEDGQSINLAVHVFRRASSTGEGGITFQPGGQQVHVTWRPDPGPDPTPTPTPTTPGPTPTSPGPTTPTPSQPGSTPPASPPSSSSAPPPPSSSEPPPHSDPPPTHEDPPSSSSAPPPPAPPSSSEPQSPSSSGPSPQSSG